MPTLTAGAVWQATLAELRAQFWTLFAVAAPFTLLVDMVVTLFGPAQPRTLAGFTPQIVLLLIVLPGIIGAVGQLAVAHLVARPALPPRSALAAALAATPAYVGAVIVSAIPTGLAFLLLVVPGLYLTARLFLVVPVAVVERGSPFAILRRSWALTAPVAWPLLGFLVLALLFLLGLSVLSSGVGSALGAVLTLVGLKAVGGFAAALVTATASTVLAIGSATAAAVIYLKLSKP